MVANYRGPGAIAPGSFTFGTPEQVEDAVKTAIRAFATEDGGCMLHGEVGQEVPFENIEALYSALRIQGLSAGLVLTA